MRKAFLVLGFLVLLVGIVVLSLPLWFGAALSRFGRDQGLTFGSYQRIGYGRFALNQVVVDRPDVQLAVSRVEAPSPLAWGWQRLRGAVGPVEAGTWTLKLSPTEPRSPKEPAEPSGWPTVHGQIRDTVASLQEWLPKAKVGAGQVETGRGVVRVAGIAWAARRLEVREIAAEGHRLTVIVTVPAAPAEFGIEIAHLDRPVGLQLKATADTVRGEVEAWQNRAPLELRFPAQGWTPTRATLQAREWTLAGEHIGTGAFYRTVTGSVSLAWNAGQFSVDAAVQGEPAESARRLPPLRMVVQAQGTPEQATVRTLEVNAPGLTARLDQPVALHRAQLLAGEGATFAVQADLGAMPWGGARGRIEGRVQLRSAGPGSAGSTASPVNASFRISAAGLQLPGSTRGDAAGGRPAVSIPRAALEGALVWPQLRVTAGTLTGESGEELAWQGGWDFARKEVLDTTVRGQLRSGTLARWLPAQPAFSAVDVDLTASGPVTAVSHRGKLAVADLRVRGVKPARVDTEWQGTGTSVERLTASLRIARTALALEAAVSPTEATVRSFELGQQGRTLLRLRQPATVAWKPSLRMADLILEGPDANLRVAATWGPQGNLQLAAAGLRSGWANDVLEQAPPDVVVESLAVAGSWDEGPARFEVGLTAAAALSRQQARLHLAATGDGKGVAVQALRLVEGDTPVADGRATLPLVLTPGASSLVHFDPEAPLAVELVTVPHADFWRRLGEATGIVIEEPQVQLAWQGSWIKPVGEMRFRARHLSLTSARFGRELPRLGEIDIALRADRQAAQIERFSLLVEGQPVRLSGRLPWPEGGWPALKENPVSLLRSQGEAEVQIADARIAAFQPYLPEAVAPAGTLTINASYRRGSLDGTLILREAATRALGPLGVVRDIAADLALDGRRLVIQSVRARAGGQPLQVSGEIALPPDGQPRFDVHVAGTNLPFVRQAGLLVRGDVDLKLATPEAGPTLISGTVRLRDSLFMRDLRTLVGGGGGGSGGGARPPPYFAVEKAPLSQWRLAVEVVGDRFMRAETPVFNGLASLDVQLTGTLGDPRATGEVTLDRGRVLMPFANFEVQRGVVRLTEQNPDQPQLDIVAETRKHGYDLKLEATGPANAPNVEFSSSPPLPSDQILLFVMAGVPPQDGIASSMTSRAVQLGAFIGKGLVGAGGGESRLKLESGADVSEQGKATYDLEYDLGNRWALTGDYNRFDEYGAGVKWRVWPRRIPGEDDVERAPRRPKDAAKFAVDGMGWLTDRSLRRTLDRVVGTDAPTLGANSVEDAAVILLSTVQEQGYQDARLRVRATGADGTVTTFDFDPTFAEPLPRDLAARQVGFEVLKGERWHVTGVTVQGVTALPRDEAEGLFYSDQALLNESANVYTPSRLSSAAAALRGRLEHAGYVDAQVDARVAEERNGAVRLAVKVQQGRRWEVAEIDLRDDVRAQVEAPDIRQWLNRPLAPTLRQDIRSEVRQAYYRAGFPDVQVQLEPAVLGREGEVVRARLTVEVDARPQVTVGQVRFEGHRHTSESVLRRRVEIGPGDRLDPLKLEEARYRISRLGVFEEVDLRYEPADGPVRDVVFRVEERPRFETSLLAGYGSYEQLRVGVDARATNLFGRAHEARLRAVQSLKSTSANLRYTVPALFGEFIDGTAEVVALRREEIAFLRQEFGVSLGLQRALASTGGMASVRYNFGALGNKRSSLVARLSDKRQLKVGSVTLALTGDRRDHPLDPRKGFDWSLRTELADPRLGGEATFQRTEVSGSYHTPWGKSRWVHVGLSHGVITTWDGDDSTLPVNRRFFPGGENSVRGYQDGEASPRHATGQFIGAKTFAILNVELEQAITPKISAVIFGDALGVSASIRDYPWRTRLYSAGVGLRYRTVIGPIRLEYGRNLNPRPFDPSGTLHFSIGYPF